MLVNTAQLLTLELMSALNRVILSYQVVVGVWLDSAEIGCLKKGKLLSRFYFETERATEEGFGYSSLSGTISFSKTDKEGDWRTGSVDGTVAEIGGTNLQTLATFSFQGIYEPRKGLVIRLYAGSSKTLVIDEFVV